MLLIVPFGPDGAQLQVLAARQELAACNEMTQRYGIRLSDDDVQALVAGRLGALETSDRIEFGRGVAAELVRAFCSSAYVSQGTFVETILELQDLFYHFKNESLESIPDDALIATMRRLFDEVAHGDLDYLAETLLDGLCRYAREEAIAEAHAALGGHKPANDADWTDQLHAPGWDGEGWLDD